MTIYNEVDDFLEHYGVKGMKWGVRKDKKRRATIVGIGIAAGYVGANFVAKRTMNVPLSLAAGAASAAVGVRMTKRILDRNKD